MILASSRFNITVSQRALLGEIFQLNRDDLVREKWLSAAEFIIPFIQPNGDFNYIGRGQKQSFGYTSCAYLLAQLIVWENRTDLIPVLSSVLRFLASNLQVATASVYSWLPYLPLVAGEKNFDPSTDPDMKNPLFCRMVSL